MAQRSGAERIREYKQLLDEGMITPEEFEAKKAQILSEAEPAESAEAEKTESSEGNVFSGHYFQDKANKANEDQKGQDSQEGQAQQQYTGGSTAGGSSLSTKATGVLAYLTWIGFLVAYFAGDRQGARFHLNQGLVVNLFGLLTGISLIGKLWGIFILVCMILGVLNASNGVNKEVPLIGGIHLL